MPKISGTTSFSRNPPSPPRGLIAASCDTSRQASSHDVKSSAQKPGPAWPATAGSSEIASHAPACAATTSRIAVKLPRSSRIACQVAAASAKMTIQPTSPSRGSKRAGSAASSGSAIAANRPKKAIQGCKCPRAFMTVPPP